MNLKKQSLTQILIRKIKKKMCKSEYHSTQTAIVFDREYFPLAAPNLRGAYDPYITLKSMEHENVNKYATLFPELIEYLNSHRGELEFRFLKVDTNKKMFTAWVFDRYHRGFRVTFEIRRIKNKEHTIEGWFRVETKSLQKHADVVFYLIEHFYRSRHCIDDDDEDEDEEVDEFEFDDFYCVHRQLDLQHDATVIYKMTNALNMQHFDLHRADKYVAEVVTSVIQNPENLCVLHNAFPELIHTVEQALSNYEYFPLLRNLRKLKYHLMKTNMTSVIVGVSDDNQCTATEHQVEQMAQLETESNNNNNLETECLTVNVHATSTAPEVVSILDGYNEKIIKITSFGEEPINNCTKDYNYFYNDVDIQNSPVACKTEKNLHYNG